MRRPLGSNAPLGNDVNVSVVSVSEQSTIRGLFSALMVSSTSPVHYEASVILFFLSPLVKVPDLNGKSNGIPVSCRVFVFVRG